MGFGWSVGFNSLTNYLQARLQSIMTLNATGMYCNNVL